MKFKSNKNAFLIDFTNTSELSKSIWVASVMTLLTIFPQLKVEGLNVSKRSAGEEKVAMMEIREGNDYLEVGSYIQKESGYDVIGVGVNGNLNVSFENKDDFRLSSCLPIYTIPVYHLEKDLNLILAKLETYIAEVVKVPKKKEVKCVTYHSNFIRVGNSRIDYDDEKDIKKLLKKVDKKSTKYSLSAIHLI